jgi:hypothetical protein
MATVFVSGVNRNFRWRQREDEPSVPGVHGRKSEDIPQERTIGFYILAVHDYMGAEDHELYSFDGWRERGKPVSQEPGPLPIYCAHRLAANPQPWSQARSISARMSCWSA